MRVLIIENNPKHLVTAHALQRSRLGSSDDVFVLTSFIEAREMIELLQPSIVMTDLYMPLTARDVPSFQHEYHPMPAHEPPLGVAIALIALARKSTRFVAIVTDGNHHNDAFTATLDAIAPFQQCGDRESRVTKLEARSFCVGDDNYDDRHIKDWGKVLAHCLERIAKLEGGATS